MNICVCGWYFNDDWARVLWKLHHELGTNVFVMANRADPVLPDLDLPYTVRENVGLEWGAYNEYLMQRWDGGPILFCHDDVAVSAVLRDYEILPPERVIHDLAPDWDQTYLFKDRRDDVRNAGKHGRMLFVSERLAQWLKDDGGIWYDTENRGYTGPGTYRNPGAGHYNLGVEAFHRLMSRAALSGYRTMGRTYVPALQLARRGDLDNLAIGT